CFFLIVIFFFIFFFFFFSSRRRHTRFDCDWSSDVCSSDLAPAKGFHKDAIRIPMMILALVGALANLYSVWRVRSLRARPAAQWKIGRASCRERGEVVVVGGGL